MLTEYNKITQHKENSKRTRECTQDFINVLKAENILAEQTKYPNYIYTEGLDYIQIICPERVNPRWCAVEAAPNDPLIFKASIPIRKNNMVHVCYARSNDNHRIEPIGFTDNLIMPQRWYDTDLKNGWENPTYRIPIGELQPIDKLMNKLLHSQYLKAEFDLYRSLPPRPPLYNNFV